MQSQHDDKASVFFFVCWKCIKSSSPCACVVEISSHDIARNMPKSIENNEKNFVYTIAFTFLTLMEWFALSISFCALFSKTYSLPISSLFVSFLSFVKSDDSKVVLSCLVVVGEKWRKNSSLSLNDIHLSVHCFVSCELSFSFIIKGVVKKVNGKCVLFSTLHWWRGRWKKKPSFQFSLIAFFEVTLTISIQSCASTSMTWNKNPETDKKLLLKSSKL